MPANYEDGVKIIYRFDYSRLAVRFGFLPTANC